MNMYYYIYIHIQNRYTQRKVISLRSTWSKYVWVNWLEIALGTHFNNIKKMQIINNNHCVSVCECVFFYSDATIVSNVWIRSSAAVTHSKMVKMVCVRHSKTIISVNYGNRLLTFGVYWIYFGFASLHTAIYANGNRWRQKPVYCARTRTHRFNCGDALCIILIIRSDICQLYEWLSINTYINTLATNKCALGSMLLQFKSIWLCHCLSSIFVRTSQCSRCALYELHG